MHTVFALLCFVVVIHWLIFPYSSGLLHWHCGNLTIAPVPAKQPWWIWINTSCEFIMNNCITTTKQSTTKPCAYFLGYTVYFKEGWRKCIDHLMNRCLAIVYLHVHDVKKNSAATKHWIQNYLCRIFQHLPVFISFTLNPTWTETSLNMLSSLHTWEIPLNMVETRRSPGNWNP